MFAGQGAQEKYCPLTAVNAVPGSQGKQLGTPATLLKPGVSPATYPAAQHAPHPAALTMPAAHAAHAAGVLAPAAAAARPDGHAEQEVSPVPPIEYVPGAHVSQEAAPAAAVKLPAPQVLQLLLPMAKENEPGLHISQEAGAEMNFPRAQRVGALHEAAPAAL